MKISEILKELNESNSSNHKLAVLKKYKDNELLARVLKMTYCKVHYTYGMSLKAVLNYEQKMLFSGLPREPLTLEDVLSYLEEYICARKITGFLALSRVVHAMRDLKTDERDIIEKIINRDLKINVGRTQINKVFKGLIVKPSYMRCGVYGDKTAKHISYPAMLNLKADGTYREFTVLDGNVTCVSRSGESYEYPAIFEAMSRLTNGIYFGELTVVIDGAVIERSKGNGLINSDNPPHDNIHLDLWDMVTFKEYTQSKLKDKKNPNTETYKERFYNLKDEIEGLSFNRINVIEHSIVNSLSEALKITSKWMSAGLEGSVLKDMTKNIFKDGTSNYQLKLKLKVSAEMRIVGFNDGKVGTKREGKVGSIIFSNDETTIKGSTSGFSDAQCDYFTENQQDLLGKIIEVEFNDLSKSDKNDYYAFSHPRFVEVRDDKDETDTLEKVFELREMALNLGGDK